MTDKAALLALIAGKNRGLLATDVDKQAILVAIAQLEAHNPTPHPLGVEALALLDGNWRLLYTTSQELLGIDRIPLATLGDVYQYIQTAESKIYNIAELNGLPYLEGLVSVAARFSPTSERRVEVKFERAIIGLKRLIGYQSPDSFIQAIKSGSKFAAIDLSIENRDRQGWLDITYLDEDLRIGRGNEGSVFVLTKQ